MKTSVRQFILFVFLLLLIEERSAAETTEINLATSGSCSPAIGINTGSVTINCRDEGLENRLRQLPDLTEYNSNINKLISLETKIDNNSLALLKIERSRQQNEDQIGMLKFELDAMDGEYLELKRDHEKFRTQLSQTLSEISQIVQEENSDLTSFVTLSIAEALIDQQIEKHSRAVINNIDYKLRNNMRLLNRLVQRIEALENDVSFLMAEFLDGRLEDKESFFGVSIGGHYLLDEWHPSLDLEYELLLPKFELVGSRVSMSVNLSWLDWKEDKEFETFPGISPVREEFDHEIVLLALGGRLYVLDWSNKIRSYLGAMFGHTVNGDEDSFYYSLAFGTEFLSRSRRVAFEYRWEEFSDIENEVSVFNPLGNATTTTNDNSVNGHFLGIRISFQ